LTFLIVLWNVLKSPARFYVLYLNGNGVTDLLPALLDMGDTLGLQSGGVNRGCSGIRQATHRRAAYGNARGAALGIRLATIMAAAGMMCSGVNINDDGNQ
jgi:hypothetical protein